jgi:gamma-glutamylputrescine oxidase
MRYTPFPRDGVFWSNSNESLPPLTQKIAANIVIIGGGMAGLSAVQRCIELGLSAVLLEQYFCGAGASGKSSGFISPDSELELSTYIDRYGPQEADRIWKVGEGGVDLIRKNIETFDFACDYQVQDSLYVATARSRFKDVQREHEARKQLGYTSHLYTAQEIAQVLNSKRYYGAVRYPETFGINAYAYCHGMKQVLLSQGAQIYEATPALRINDKKVYTPLGEVAAEHVIVCADYFLPQLGFLPKTVYHAQTFLMLSAPLSSHQVQTIFPDKPCMVWDTELIFNYFRLIADNRLLLGGGTVLATFADKEYHDYKPMVRKLKNYIAQVFPDLNLYFEHLWPGLLGITQDLSPIAGYDRSHSWLYFVAASTGLPWAAALGRYSVDRIQGNRKDLDAYFSPYRPYPIGTISQALLGTKVTFALGNIISKYR